MLEVVVVEVPVVVIQIVLEVLEAVVIKVVVVVEVPVAGCSNMSLLHSLRCSYEHQFGVERGRRTEIK